MTASKKVLLGSLGIITAAASGLYAVLYAPLAADLHRTGAQCVALEKDAALVRDAAASLKRSGGTQSVGTKLLDESDISSAIDELTSMGKLHKVRYRSLTPREAPADTGSGYRALPVEIEAESGYRELGIFLADLETVPKGLFTVESFDLASDPRNPSLFRSRITLDLYLAPPAVGEPQEADSREDLLAPQRTAKKSEHDAWSRNPFEVQRNAPVSNAAGLVLNGIAYDKVSPAAIINEKIVKVGDFVGGYQVSAIYHDRVVVSGDSQTVEIELNAETAGEI